MKKGISLLTALLSTSLLLSSTYAIADHAPPGLEQKGGAIFPQGLENQGKTPEGWSHGEKRGWDHDRDRHGWDKGHHHKKWHKHKHHHHHD